MLTRFSTIIWMILIVVAAFGLYTVKYRVQALQEEVAVQEKLLKEERESLHVLEAEWAYLNRPERLASLASRHLKLAPTEGRQISEIDALPYPPTPVAQADEATPVPAVRPLPNTAKLVKAGAIIHGR